MIAASDAVHQPLLVYSSDYFVAKNFLNGQGLPAEGSSFSNEWSSVALAASGDERRLLVPCQVG